MITEQRLRFEARHPVPEYAVWSEEEKCYCESSINITPIEHMLLDLYNALFDGYQSALEDMQGEHVATIECDFDATDGSKRVEYDYKDIQRFPDGTKLFASPQPAQQASGPTAAYLVDGRVEQGLFFDKESAEKMAEVNCGTVVELVRHDILALRKGA